MSELLRATKSKSLAVGQAPKPETSPEHARRLSKGRDSYAGSQQNIGGDLQNMQGSKLAVCSTMGNSSVSRAQKQAESLGAEDETTALD